MSTSRHHWTSQGRRNDKKRDRKDDFEEFFEKKLREAMDFRDDNDRLRADRKKDRQEIERLRADNRQKDAELARKDAELARKDAQLANLEQECQEASERQTKRARAAVEQLLEVFAAHAKNDDGDSADPSSDQGDGADPLRATLPEDPLPTLPEAATTGPGEAAPGPEEEEEEAAAKMQDEAIERASRSNRSDIPEMPQASGGQ